MIDSHCHLDLTEFDNTREHVIQSALQLGVERFLVPGLSIKQFTTLLNLQQRFECIDIALGCHPYFLKQLGPSQFSQQTQHMGDLAHQHMAGIVAIGECGLDGSLDIPMAYQEKVLREHIQLAKAINKPLILHHRRSHNALIRILKQEKFEGGGVIHAFSGSYETAQAYIDLGFALGVGGTISYARARKTRGTIKAVGIEHLLLETDAPDMPVFGFQGQTNTPERLPLIAAALADLKDMPQECLEQSTSLNYHRIFMRHNHHGS